MIVTPFAGNRIRLTIASDDVDEETMAAPTLERGDRVWVVAPGFAVRRRDLDAGVSALERRGYRVRLGRHVLAREGYLAGGDAERTDDLVTALTDPDSRAVWFARGGYGSARLLDRLPWRRLRGLTKLLVGYSDLTALYAPVLERATGARCLYGPGVTELPQRSLWHGPSLRNALAGRAVSLRVARRDVLVSGRARGVLKGGNLTVAAHLLGTRFAPRFRDAILFLEDVGEATYRLDRSLTQLRQAGAFSGVRAVLLGGFGVPARRRFPPDRPLDDVVREAFAGLGVPVVRGIPAGHVAGKRTLPLGGTAQVDTDAGRIELTP